MRLSESVQIRCKTSETLPFPLISYPPLAGLFGSESAERPDGRSGLPHAALRDAGRDALEMNRNSAPTHSRALAEASHPDLL